MAAKQDSNEPDSATKGERLQKVLAAAGLGSRRKCEEFVQTGRVTVDGQIVTDLSYRVESSEHDIRVDGERLRPQVKRYYLLNKPKGAVCTNYDPQGRPRAIDLIRSNETRLFTVGRLDESSEGLLLITNDGEFAQKLAHPKFQVPRVYKVQVAGIPSADTLAEIRKGIHFTEGRFFVRRARRLKTHGKSSFIEVELTQGRNREIRRLFARVGHKVMWLQRIAFGPVKLGDLSPGKYRNLTTAEIEQLKTLRTGRSKSQDDGEKKSGPSLRRKNVKSRASSSKKRANRKIGTPETKNVVSRRRILNLTDDDSAPQPENKKSSQSYNTRGRKTGRGPKKPRTNRRNS